MLAALIMAGLFTAAFAPVVMDMLSDDDDDGIDPVEPGAGKAQYLSVTEDAMSEGAIYDIPATSASSVLTSFDAGSDRVTLHSDSWETEFVVEDLEDGGVAISFAVGDGPVSVSFPGLAELPAEAIDVMIQAPDDAAPVSMTLAEILASAEAIEDDAPPLSPVDPDAPDLPGSGTGDDIALSPVDPDAPDVADGLPVTEDVLQPVTEDDVPMALPTTQNVSWLVPGKGGAAATPPVIEDFSAADDVLSVTLKPGFSDGPLDVTIVPSADGADGIVQVDGTPVAILRGVPDASPSQIHVELQSKLTY